MMTRIETGGAWVILLTDRRELGEPIRLAMSPRLGTHHRDLAAEFKSEIEALGWWLNLPADGHLRTHFVMTIERL